MTVLFLILPVFAVIFAGWLAGALGYLPRSLSGPLVQFTFNVAMPALLFLTLAEQKLSGLVEWRFAAAFAVGSLLSFAAAGAGAHLLYGRDMRSSGVIGALAAMTNTGFVALPILQTLYGALGVTAAAVATIVVGVLMFPPLVILLEWRQGGATGAQTATLIRHTIANPLILSTVAGVVWSALGLGLWPIVREFLALLAAALTPTALFAVGLGMSLAGLRGHVSLLAATTAFKLVVTPLVVFALCRALGLGATGTASAVVCAAVPTAKTAYILASEYDVEAATAGSVVSLTTLASVVTLLAWLALLT